MAIGFRRLRGELRKLLPLHSAGNGYHVSRNHRGYRQEVYSHDLSLNSSPMAFDKYKRNVIEGGGHIKRYSTASDTLHEPLPKVDLLSYIESTLDKLEGPSHCWLNKIAYTNNFNQKDGVFLVLACSFTDNFFKPSGDSVVMFEKVKSLQQRYPSLNVIGLQSSRSISSDVRTRLIQMTLSEYITFPILISSKTYSEMKDGACYILFKGLKNPPILYNKDVDLGIIDKAIKELNVEHIEKPSLTHNVSSTWVKPIEVIQEPDLCCSLRTLLLCFPGCISVDEIDDRFFLSDINHHRIIVFESGGKILDCIGSSPGFEDGEFELAKLNRPAASFYHDADDSLFFVDSENHAIRRADMERRVVETVYPRSNTNTSPSFWSWIVDKLWAKGDVDTSPEEFDSRSFLFPWHLIKSSDGDIFVLNRSFETLWTMDLATGVIKEVINGFPNVLEICGQEILEKASLLKQVPSHWLQQHIDSTISFDDIPYAGLMSSVASIQDNIVICDTVGQMVLKLCKKTGSISSFQFSNFGILGLPYWLSFSLERVYPGANALSRVQVDHIQRFTLLPGRIEAQLTIDIPEGTELVEPLQEGCIWRQTRGTGAEISGAENEATSLEKVGAAQQWYNDLDNLASLTQEIEVTAEEEKNSSDGKLEDGKIRIDCIINTSPGTCEVIVYAALYLRMKRPSNSSDDTREKQVARMVELLNPSGRENEHLNADACLKLLSSSERDIGELVFVRPLHVRLQIDCLDHPKADNSKDIILTDASIEVNVSLK